MALNHNEQSSDSQRVQITKKHKNPYVRYIIAVFSALLLLGMFISILFPLRPKYSETEKRELTKFPKFSFSSLGDGSFFGGVSTWYADTFPFREFFISVSDKISSFHGFGDSLSSLPDVVSEEIPEYVEPDETVTEEEEVTLFDDGNHVVQNLGSILVVDDAGYEYYGFVKSAADRYISMINNSALNLKGTARVFDILVPTSMAITLPDSAAKNVNTGNQSDAIEYYYSGIKDDTIKVRCFDAIRKHRGEYVYFRTDHHWTANGAYYAYREFTKAAGLETAALTDFTEKTFPNFVGSFYYDANKDPALLSNPDVVHAYEPKGDYSFSYTNKSGEVVDWFIIADVSTWNDSGKYNCFIGSDNPYSVIKNNASAGGKSCVVVKESYGNCFIPFLAANYDTVHIIDYRYWQGSLKSFVTQNDVDDVIYINNLSSIRSSNALSGLERIQ